MLRAVYLFVFGILVTLTTLACSQETSIDNALSVSRRTGKPIFAIASRKICPPCRLLKSRVAAFFENSKTSDQVVYLRVNIDDQQAWGRWSRQFSHTGKMIPIVYLIRADQRQMYGRNNTLAGDQLEKFLEQGVAACGESFNEEQVKQIQSVNANIKSALDKKEYPAAARWVLTCGEFGSPGKIKSFASCAIENNRLSERVFRESESYVNEKVAEIVPKLSGNPEDRFNAIYEFVTLERLFGKIPAVSDQLSSVAVKLAIDSQLRTFWTQAREIYDANDVLTSQRDEERIEKALATLTTIQGSDSIDVVKQAAREGINRHNATVARVSNNPNTK